MRETEGGKITAVIQKTSSQELTRVVTMETTIVSMIAIMY